MTMYKVRLACPVKLTASLEFAMKAESEDDAYEKAFDEYKRLDEEYQAKLKEYWRTHTGAYPEAPFYWGVDQDDIEGNMDERNIEVSDVEVIE